LPLGHRRVALVGHGSVPSVVLADFLRTNKEGQEHFALFADQTQKMLSLSGYLFFEVDIAHDHCADWNALYFSVCLGDYDCVHIQDQVANRRRFFFQREYSGGLAGGDFWIVRRLRVSGGGNSDCAQY
jgi:hypothetical protein